MKTRPLSDLLEEKLEDKAALEIKPVAKVATDAPQAMPVSTTGRPVKASFALPLPDPNLLPTPSLPKQAKEKATPKAAVEVKVETREDKLNRLVQKAFNHYQHQPKPKKVKAMEQMGQLSLF